jgi:adenylate cyclase
MSNEKLSEELIREIWRGYLADGELMENLGAPWYVRKRFRPFVRSFPTSPRCDFCFMPFGGLGGKISKAFWNIEPSKLNPHICNNCERFAQEFHGGVELEISMLFVDVRGSTTLAEKTSPEVFSKLINRFYRAATEEFYRSYGLVEKLIGDQVAGFFAPGVAGKDHARVAIETGKSIMKKMGYGSSSEPWISVGIGIHTGIAYVGSVIAEGGADIAMLGDSVNTTARLTSQAAAGEILVSDSTREAAGLDTKGLESRNLNLKGKSEEVLTWVLKAR